MFQNKIFKIILIFLTLAVTSIYALYLPATDTIFKNGRLFPYIYFTETINNFRRAELSQPFWVKTEEEVNRLNLITSNQISLLLNNYIVAYYGHPNSRNMGILGRHSIEELDKLLSATAASYRAISGERGVIRAFYLIYATIWPCANVGILNHNTLMRYINYGLENDILVFIDHQMGRHDPVDALRSMFRFLHYPNVHLALDPEWRTLRPNIEIGHVTADELNRAQQAMEDYLNANNLPGERMLVIHQFNHVMIRNWADVRADFHRVRLVHSISGIGTPAMKRNTYNVFGGRATNMPIKGFKLWYDFGFVGHTDTPLMTPQEVFALRPRPMLIIYQ